MIRFSIQRKGDDLLITDNNNGKALYSCRMEDLKQIVDLLNYYHQELSEQKSSVVETKTIIKYK